MKQEEKITAEHDEQDALWELLGKAKSYQANKHFVESTLQAARASSQKQMVSPFKIFLKASTAIAACVAIAFVLISYSSKEKQYASAYEYIQEMTDYQSLSDEVSELIQQELIAEASNDLDAFTQEELFNLVMN